MWLINLISNLELTIAAAKVESNIHIHSSSSLIWYATGVDSLLITVKATNAPDLDSSRTIAEGEERVTAWCCDVHFIDVKEMTDIGTTGTRYAAEFTDSSTSTSQNDAIVWECNMAMSNIDTST